MGGSELGVRGASNKTSLRVQCFWSVCDSIKKVNSEVCLNYGPLSVSTFRPTIRDERKWITATLLAHE